MASWYPTERGDVSHRKGGLPQKGAGPADAVIQQIFLGGDAGDILEKAVEIRPFNVQIVGDNLDIDRIGVVALHIPQGFFHIGDLLFLDGDGLAGNLLASR